MFIQPSQSSSTTMTTTYPNIPIPPQQILQFHPTYNNTHICLTNNSIKHMTKNQKISHFELKGTSQQQPIQKYSTNEKKMSIAHLSFNGDIINTLEIDRGNYQLGVIYEWEVIVFGTVYQDNPRKKHHKLFIWNFVNDYVRNIQYVPDQASVQSFQLLTFGISKLFCICQVIFNENSPMMGYQWYETKAVKLSYYSVNLEDQTTRNAKKVSQSLNQSQNKQLKQQQQEGLSKMLKNTQKQQQTVQKTQQQITNTKHHPTPQNPQPITTKTTNINLLYSTTQYTTLQQIKFRDFNILKINQHSSIAFINRSRTFLKQDYFRIVGLQYNENEQLYLSQNQLCFQHVPRKDVSFMGLDDIWQVESQQGMCLYLKFNSANHDNGKYHQFSCIWNYDYEEFLYQQLKYELVFHQQIVGSWRDLGRMKNSWSTKYGVQHNQKIYFLQPVDHQYKITGSQTQPQNQPKLIQYSTYDSSHLNQTLHPTFLTNISFNYRYTTDNKFMITQTQYQQVVFNTLQLNAFFMIEIMQDGGCECECDQDLIMRVCELGGGYGQNEAQEEEQEQEQQQEQEQV